MFKNWAKVRIRDDGVESEGAVFVYDERTSRKGEYRYGDTVLLLLDRLNLSEDGTYKVVGGGLDRLSIAPKIHGVYDTRNTLSVDKGSVRIANQEGIKITVNGGYRRLEKGEVVVPKDQKLQNDNWYVAAETTDRVLEIKTIDNRKSTIVFRDEVFIPSDYYPTAEQARRIEPKIRQGLVEDSVSRTLGFVEDQAKEGRNIAGIEFGVYVHAKPAYLTRAEKRKVMDVLESLGYNIYGGCVEW